jgi:hypothetical protein
MKAISDEGMRQIEARNLAAYQEQQQLQEQIQQQYGQEAFGQYIERTSEKERQPGEGHDEEQEPELQAIEYTPQ